MPGDRGLMAPLKTNVKCKHFTRGKHCRRNVSSHFSPSTFRFYSNIAKAFRLAAFYVCFVKNIFLVGRVPRLLSQNAEYAVVPVLCFYSSSSTSSCSCSCFSWLFFLFMFGLFFRFSFCPSWQFQSRTFCCKPVGNNTESTQAFVSVACGIAHTPEVTTSKKQQPR